MEGKVKIENKPQYVVKILQKRARKWQRRTDRKNIVVYDWTYGMPSLWLPGVRIRPSLSS